MKNPELRHFGPKPPESKELNPQELEIYEGLSSLREAPTATEKKRLENGSQNVSAEDKEYLKKDSAEDIKNELFKKIEEVDFASGEKLIKDPKLIRELSVLREDMRDLLKQKDVREQVSQADYSRYVMLSEVLESLPALDVVDQNDDTQPDRYITTEEINERFAELEKLARQ